eukprot:5497397-Pleurochrysis_carterae.AAC.1
MPGNTRCGASGTPAFSPSRSAATCNSAAHSACARPPRRSGATSCAARLHPRAPPTVGRDTA